MTEQKKTQNEQPPNQQPYNYSADDMSWGCVLWFAGVPIGILLIIMLVSGVFSSDDYESDDDCNDSYIEEDYNGDGEEDAEDFRIQTEGC